MKPEHTKPFDLAATKVGAPYCCRDGQPATILKWDRRTADYPLIGVCTEHDDPNTWTTGGCEFDSENESECDLVMIPLGICEGKPVWWGDELLSPAGTPFKVAQMRISTPVAQYIAQCTWPKPAPRYPQTKMNDSELFKSFTEGNGCYSSDFLRVVANTAIARSIQDGDVVPAATLEKVAHAMNQRVLMPGHPVSDNAIAAIIKAVREGKS